MERDGDLETQMERDGDLKLNCLKTQSPILDLIHLPLNEAERGWIEKTLNQR